MSTPRKKAATSRTLFRRVLITVVVVGLALAALWYWTAHKTAADEGVWRTTAVERGNIRVAISATGTLSAISTVTVGSQVSGQVTDVLADFNDKVVKGQVIARIDPSSYEAQISQGNAQIASAQASLRLAQATLRNAQVDYQRKADLGRQQLVARSEIDLAQASRDQAQAQVNAAQAQISQQVAATQTTRINLGRTVIRSPVDGVVLTRTIEPGQTVAANFSAPELFTIAEDLGKMKIELAVDESDIGQVKVGQAVSFTADAFPDRQFKGVVEQVRLSATTTSNVVTYPVVVTVDNSDDTLLPGLTVNAEIEVSKRDDILKVANAALRYKPADDAAAAAGPPATAARGGGTGIVDDLARGTASLKLDAAQQAAFDAATEAIKQRFAARQAAQPSGGGNSLFGRGGGMRMSTGGGGDMQAQMRQRMLERYQKDFAAFRATLDDVQRKDWDAAVSTLVGARRAALYKLVDGQAQMTMVRIGASDGTSTEISGDIKAGDQIITGERAAP
ncbi:MAG: efflux RND transporter periplasmic adaptor subunit [Luteimonas sp.]